MISGMAVRDGSFEIESTEPSPATDSHFGPDETAFPVTAAFRFDEAGDGSRLLATLVFDLNSMKKCHSVR